jgi:succinoglycan biosynthesis transport protein ExoP
MMSQDNRLLPLPSASLDRPLSDLTQSKKYYGASIAEPTHLRDYLAVVLKRKWLILSLVVVVTSLVTVQMYRQPPIYEAETTIQIEPKRNIIQTKEITLNTGNDPTYWNTQLKLLENPQLARQVIIALDLQNNPAFLEGQASSGFFGGLRRLFFGEKAAPASVSTNTVPVVDSASVTADQLTPAQLEKLEPYEDTLRSNLTVEPVERTSLVTLKFRHSNPEIAQKVADTLAQVFIYNDLRHTTSGQRTAAEDLANQIADLQLKIRQDTERLTNYKKSHDIPITSAQGGNITDARVGNYSSQLLEAEEKRKKAQADYDAARNSPDPWSIPELQDDKSVQGLREKLGNLQEKRAALMEIYTAEWPAVKALDQQINQVDSELKRKPAEIITALKLRYERALDTEQKIKADYQRESAKAQQQGIAVIDIDSLNREIETNKQLYSTLYQKQNELRMSTNEGNVNNVTVATPARLPRGPVGPARSRNIVVAFLLSLGVGIGLAFLLDYLDDTLKSVEDVDRYIHLPALALIPALRNDRALLKGKNNQPATDPKENSTALALIEDVRSPVAEAYRHLRTSLLLSTAGQPPKTILVTSSQPSEGKTTTAVNTAVMLAQTGAKVLIIDCDLRRPRVHTHFNMLNGQGVTNYLSGETDADALMQPYDKMPNLMVMTSGPVPPNPAELLGSDEMRKLLNTMSERFTHIVVDSPPSISFTDSSILSTMVDGVMLVVHGGKSSRAIVRRAKQQLLDIGANIFGIVLNNVKLEGNSSYYYYGYYSSYYGSDDDETLAVDDADLGSAR